MPQANCDTGRKIWPSKRSAEIASADGKGVRCDRCRGWHANTDRPKSRRGKR